jgi:hypothetical protein
MLIVEKSLEIENTNPPVEDSSKVLDLFPAKEDDRLSTMSRRYGYPDRF